VSTSRSGTIAIFIAKLVFMAAGYALVIGLARSLSQEQFGDYSVVFGAVALVNMVVVNGTLQTVSRFVAARAEGAERTRRRAFSYQLVFASAIIGAVLLGADAFAAALGDAALAPVLRAAMAITAIYAFYAINVGYLNGKRRFVAQATLDISFSVLKVAFILTATKLGHGLHGVVAGFAGAAAVVCLLSFVFAGVSFLRAQPAPADAEDPSAKAFARFAFSVMGVALIVNCVMQADLFLLKGLSDADVAARATGLYGAAQQVARIPYYLMVTASLVLFPVVAALNASSEVSRRRRADTVSQAFTAILGLVVGMAAVTAPMAERVLGVLFPASYADAAPAFAWLVTALVLLTVVNVSVTMISGAGRPGVSVAILLVTLLVQAAAAALLIPAYGIEGAALATLVAAVLATGLCVVVLRPLLGLRIAPRVPIVLVGATVATVLLVATLDRFAADSRVLTVLICGAAYAMYLGLLAVGGVLLGAKAREDRILLVTKPLAPPYNDGSKVFPRLLAETLPVAGVELLSTKAGRRALEHELGERCPGVVAAYPSAASFAGRKLQNLSVFAYLLLTRFHYRGLHFFFAPNPLTCRAIRLLRLLSPRVAFVQTVMSRPRSYEGGRSLLFGDVITAGSDDTAMKLREATGREVRVVRPGIRSEVAPVSREEALRAHGLPLSALHVLFAGDIDEGGALEHLRRLAPALLQREQRSHFHLSVRRKAEETEAKARAFFEEHLAPFQGRAHIYVDHTPFPELLDLADAAVLPQEDLIAKVDAPLVVLELMARGKPVFLLDRPPLDEILPPSLRGLLLAATIDDMVDQVLAYIADPTRVSSALLSARVADEFDVSRAASDFEEIHASL
jgi:stage V sporulation protein B